VALTTAFIVGFEHVEVNAQNLFIFFIKCGLIILCHVYLIYIHKNVVFTFLVFTGIAELEIQ
jgi:hypothetical protein